MKRHIIQVSSYYPPHLGGQENAVQSLAHQLAAAGHRVQVLASAQGSAPGIQHEESVEVKRLPSFVFGHAPIMLGFPLSLFRMSSPKSIVHLHVGQAFTPEMVWLLCKLRGFKYIAQLHIDFQPSGLAGILLPLYKRLILKRVLHSAAAVVTLNQKTAQAIRERYGFKRPVHVMHNGIDDAFFKLKRSAFTKHPPKMLRLLFVGRLSKQKNIVALLKALKQTNKSVHLDLIGEGEERQTVEALITQLGLNNVTVHGRLPRERVMRFYETCDALIMPSLYEAQPLVLLEAMAARIPIIGTKVIGVEDHLKHAGILVPPTPDGLVNGIEQYFSRFTELPELIERGYQKAVSLSWPHILKTYEGLYETIGD